MAMRSWLTFRMGRLRYLMWTVVCLPMLMLAAPLIGSDVRIEQRGWWLDVLPYGAPLLWSFMACAPRLRDIGWSGWLAIAPLAALATAGVLRATRIGGVAGAGAMANALVLAAIAFVLLLALRGPRRESLKQVFS
jgi:hypothetical protein